MSYFRHTLFLCFALTLTTTHCRATTDGTDSREAVVLWQNLTNYVKDFAKEFSVNNRPFVEQLLRNARNVSKICSNSLMAGVDAIEALDDWGLMMINAWGSFPPKGVFEGTLTDFGAYDQCLSITPNELIGQAQYCSVRFVPIIPRPMPKQHNMYHKIPNLLPKEFYANKSNAMNMIANEASMFYWVSIRTGICTPAKCTRNDIQAIALKVAEMLGLELQSIKCESKANVSFNQIQLLAIFVFITFLILCLTATVFDLNLNIEKNTKRFTFVRLFSANKSVQRLVGATTSKDLSCIHGIRVFTIVWILYGHSIQWSHFQMYGRGFRAKELLTDFLIQPFVNGEYGVVSFLLISGILTSYMALSVTKANPKRFRVHLFIALRAARLLPQLMIFILLSFLLPSMSSGPVWDEVVGQNIRKCETNWWLNLFLIQNLFRADQMCALHTWFIALDFQYHIMAALLIIAFLRNSRLGFIVNITFIVLFTVMSSIMLYAYELPPALINTGRTEYFEKYYSFTYHKIPVSFGAVYFIGTLFGYGIYRRNSFNISKPFLTIIWMSIMAAYCLPLWDKVYWNYGQPYTALSSVFYTIFQMIWTVCTSLLIWLCISGNGGILNRFLSAKLFIPFARLTYSVYLCHAWLIWYYVGSRRHLIDTNMYNVLSNFIHITVMSYSIGFAFFLLFESPVLEMQKYVNEWLSAKHANDRRDGIQMNESLKQ